MTTYQVTYPNGKTQKFSSKRKSVFNHAVIGLFKNEWHIVAKSSSNNPANTLKKEERRIGYEELKLASVEVI